MLRVPKALFQLVHRDADNAIDIQIAREAQPTEQRVHDEIQHDNGENENGWPVECGEHDQQARNHDESQQNCHDNFDLNQKTRKMGLTFSQCKTGHGFLE